MSVNFNYNKVAGAVIIVVLAVAVFVGFRMIHSAHNAILNDGPIATDNSDSILSYADSELEMGKYDSAIKGFKVIIDGKIDGDKKEKALFKMAEAYEKKGDLIKAREAYKRLIDEFPSSGDITALQGKLEGINMELLFSPSLMDGDFEYEIKPGDSLSVIARNNKTTVELLKRSNNLKRDIIIPGKKLKVTTAVFSIYVDKSQNVLFLKRNNEIFKTYVVATGKDNSTPVGQFKIEEKLVSPLWYKVNAVVSLTARSMNSGQDGWVFL
jgi:LysM repeat protein